MMLLLRSKVSDEFSPFLSKLKHQDALLFNLEETGSHNSPLKKLLNPFIRRPYALEIIQEIELYVFSEGFSKACNDSEIVAVKYALFSLHIWLIQNRLQQEVNLDAWRIKKSLNSLFESYTKDVVYQFQDYFDKDVYSELSRINRTLFYSLDDLFVFNNTERSLEDIIIDEVLLGTIEDPAQIEHLAQYIHKRRDYLRHFKSIDLKTKGIFWALSM